MQNNKQIKSFDVPITQEHGKTRQRWDLNTQYEVLKLCHSSLQRNAGHKTSQASGKSQLSPTFILSQFSSINPSRFRVVVPGLCLE